MTSLFLQQLNKVNAKEIDLVKATANQIIKDFGIAGLVIQFSEKETDPHLTLFNQIKPLIEEMINTDFSKLLNLLYRIDISEKILNKKLATTPPEEVANLITETIIEREFRKVVTRMYYSQFG